MSTYTERLPYTGSPEYDKHFWNAMRGRDSSFDELSKGYSTGIGLYALPNSSDNKYMAPLKKKACSAISVQLLRHTALVTVFLPKIAATLPSG